MSTSLDVADFDDDPHAPEGYKSATAKTPYLTVVSIASVAFFLGQFVLPQLVMLALMPGFAGGEMMFQMNMPEVHKAAAWQDQIWVPVNQLGTGAAPRTVLQAANFDGKWVEDSEISLNFPPEHLLADGERLWAVGNGNVAIIEGRNVTTSYPKLRLNEPSNPYLQDGRLRIVDRDAQGNWRILEFDEGEWTAVAALVLPPLSTLSNTPAIARSMSGGERLHVLVHAAGTTAIFSDQVEHWIADSVPEEPLADPSVDEPVSALDALDAPASPWQAYELTSDVIPVRLEGRLAVVDSSGPPMGGKLDASWLEGGRLVPFGTLSLPLSEHHGIVTDAEGRVFVLADSFPPGEVRVTELTADGFLSPDTAQKPSLFTGMIGQFARMYAVLLTIPYGLLAIYVLVLHVAMRACRNPRYGFAHRTVRLASIGRRAMARAVDTLLMTLPMIALAGWFLATFDVEQFVQQMQTNPQQMVITILVSVFGTLAYMLLLAIVFGTLEGVYGWSPGKLVCGLRVIRTTLEPIGVLRGLIRQFLLLADGFFNYLVGGAMVAVLTKQQRLGDLAADSIVIEAASLETDRPTP